MGLLLGIVNQVVALLGRLVGVARLVLGHHVVRVVRLLVFLLSSFHDGYVLDNQLQ